MMGARLNRNLSAPPGVIPAFDFHPGRVFDGRGASRVGISAQGLADAASPLRSVLFYTKGQSLGGAHGDEHVILEQLASRGVDPTTVGPIALAMGVPIAPLAILVEGDRQLAEEVHVMRSFRSPHPAARIFVAWIAGPRGRAVVAAQRGYRVPTA